MNSSPARVFNDYIDMEIVSPINTKQSNILLRKTPSVRININKATNKEQEITINETSHKNRGVTQR